MPSRSTPAGEHRPVMLAEVLSILDPKPGDIAVDCTLGAAGHAVELFKRIGPSGKLIALDLDPANMEPARQKLALIGDNFELHATNFAALPRLVPDGADFVFADLGVSSMQIDDPARGFSYRRPGPLDMRMDPGRGHTAAQVLEAIDVEELTTVLRELGDFDEFGTQAAQRLAVEIVASKPQSTGELTAIVLKCVPPPAAPPGRQVKAWQLQYRPVACAYQALRILVNRELANLGEWLRVLPYVLRVGGRAAVISFHSGEDRLVKQAFRDGMRNGVYVEVAEEPVRPNYQERMENPRSRSAKVRWARR